MGRSDRAAPREKGLVGGTRSADRFSPFARALAFLATHGRPLERSLAAWEFAGGPRRRPRMELGRFQNADGGYGRALEPDFRLPDSSALATSIGLQVASRLRLPPEDRRVRGALGYLARAYRPALVGWPIVPPEVRRYPRADWWEPPDGSRSDSRWANPSAELAGYLFEWPGIVPERVRDELLRRSIGRLRSSREALEMHDLLCYLRLAERLPAGPSRVVYRLLDPHVRNEIGRSPQSWREYGLRPLQVASTPRARYARALSAVLRRNLDFLETTQAADGGWDPTWEWGRFRRVWPKAREEWRGALTLENARALHAFGRSALPRAMPKRNIGPVGG